MQFRALERNINKPSRNYRSTSSPWIFDTTWKIEDQRTALGMKIRTNQGERRVLTRRFQAALKEYRRIKVRRVGNEIKTLVSNNQVREAWSKTQRWYRVSKGHLVPPTSEQLDQTSNLWEHLYMQRPLEGESIPILLQPLRINDGTP